MGVDYKLLLKIIFISSLVDGCDEIGDGVFGGMLRYWGNYYWGEVFGFFFWILVCFKVGIGLE